jgi:ferric-dicitrate binding protein FerR (iron transport regulator)
MEINTEHRRFHSGLALLLCFLLLLSSDTGYCDTGQPATTDVVGKVTGVRSAATRNGTSFSLNDVVHANDILKTDDSGRIGIELQDGSILSLGSNTELSIANHDSVTGTTLAKLTNGRLRSRITKLRSSGKFVIATPHGTVTALGTDFFLDVNDQNGTTELVVYSGVLLVTASNASNDLDRKLVLDVAAGQNVLMDDKGIRYLQLTPSGVEGQTIAETTVPEPTAEPVAATAEPAAKKPSHTLRNVTIGALAAGAGIGAALGLRGSKSQPSSSTPSTPPTIPAH